MRVQKSEMSASYAPTTKVGQKVKTRKVAARIKETSHRKKRTEREAKGGSPAPKDSQRQPTYKKEADQSSFTFVPCSLLGPDGQSRPGWEMRVGEMTFGRADSQETLLAYYTRLHDPLPSGHWRERTWQQTKKKVAKGQALAEHGEVEEQEEQLDHEDAGFTLDDVIEDMDEE